MHDPDHDSDIPSVAHARTRQPTPTRQLLNPGLAGSSYAPSPVYLEPGTVLASRPIQQCSDAESSPSWAVARVTAPVNTVIHDYTQQFQNYDTTYDYTDTIGAEHISGAWMDEGGGDLRAITIVAPWACRPGPSSHQHQLRTDHGVGSRSPSTTRTEK